MVATVALAVELLTIGLTFCPVRAPLKVIVNGPPVLPVTVTLPTRDGIVARLACTSASVVPLVPVVTVSGEVAVWIPVPGSNDNVVVPLATNVNVCTSSVTVSAAFAGVPLNEG